MFLSLLACLTAPAETQAQDPEAHYQAGVAALQAKEAEKAKAELSACVAADATRVDCHWELGWANWLLADWAGTVEAWNQVKTLDPSHKQVDQYLPTAQGHLATEAMVANAAKGAPTTLGAGVAEGTTVRLRAVGDVMLGTDFPAGKLPPNDGANLLDAVGPMLQDADLTFINLEGPLCDGGKTTKCGSGSNCYAFRSPTRYGDYLAQWGVDLASTANNHASDFGDFCRVETEKTLDGLGIAYSGRPGTVASVESNGLRIAMLGFHTSKSGHYVNDHDAAAELVRAVDMTHDLVIVSFHGGAEGSKALHVPYGGEKFYGEDRGNLREFTHVVVDAGADLVLGHGPHVPRAMEIYKDRLIAYSLGNFATYGRFNLSGYLGVGLILDVTLDSEGKFVSGQILPTKQIGEGVPQPDPDNKAVDLIRKLSKEDFPATGVQVAQDGTLGRK